MPLRPTTAAIVGVLALTAVACGRADVADQQPPSPTPVAADPANTDPSPTPTAKDPEDPGGPTDLPTTTDGPEAITTPTPGPTPTPSPKPVAEPVSETGVLPQRIEIPSIDVDAAVVDLAIGPGDPEVPEAWEDAGWYTTTRRPGEIGPAVIAGHIDSTAGPAVFFRLDELRSGDEIILHGPNGTRRTFTVQDAGQYPKERLPDEVFGFGDRRPELRLITCGGSFDRSVGHYEDNLVVYAAQAT